MRPRRVSKLGKYNLSASDNAERMSFLSQFGWQVKEEPLEICEIVLPAQFNETYHNYNEIQKQQGLDLSRYAGKTCKRWTYEITNYPDQPEGVHANLLIIDGRVIGGDISSTQLNGFMHGFINPTAAGSQEGTSQAQSMEEISTSSLLPVESSTGTGDVGAGPGNAGSPCGLKNKIESAAGFFIPPPELIKNGEKTWQRNVWTSFWLLKEWEAEKKWRI